MYKTLQEFGSETNAVKWSVMLEKTFSGQQYAKYNPCTTVYKLVQELRGLSEDLKQKIEEKYLTGE
jgi:hypothetical protein